MRSRITLLTIVLFAGVGLAQADDLMWDNYPSDYVGQVLVEPDAVLQDMSKNMSSERNTQVVYSTWVIDDVDMAQVPGANLNVAELSRLTWVGAREASNTYSRADVILLTRDDSRETFTTVYEFSDLEYTFTDFDSSLSPYSQAYEGEIVFDNAIPISELGEHFYIGVRLVGDGYLEGRNHLVTSSIGDTIRGRTEGYTHAAGFGADTYYPAADIWYGGPSTANFEFAFRTYGVIPEPASVAFLLVGGLVLLRRR